MIIDWSRGANAQLVAYQWPVFNWITGESGAAPEPEVEAETPSGGWRRRHAPEGFRQREQTDEEIKAERVRMGILPPDPAPEPAAGSMAAIFGKPPDLAHNFGEQAPSSLAAHLLPEDLAGLEALAARAAELAMDHEIALWLRLGEQRRLHEAWLRDEEDTAVLLLAIATLH
jgi:hypothetical protein